MNAALNFKLYKSAFYNINTIRICLSFARQMMVRVVYIQVEYFIITFTKVVINFISTSKTVKHVVYIHILCVQKQQQSPQYCDKKNVKKSKFSIKFHIFRAIIQHGSCN